MDDTETPTQVEVPTPTEVAEAPRTEAAEATPAQEPAPEAEAAETKLEEAPKIPWADKADFYDVLEMEEAKPYLERRDQRRDETVKADYQRQYDAATGNWKATEAYKQLAGISGTILEKIGEGDTETVGKLVGRMEQLVEPFSEAYKDGLKAEGSQKAATELYGAVTGSLDHRGQDELQDYLATNRNANWGDILKKRDEIREGKSKKSNSDKVTSLEAQIEALKGKARDDGPDPAPKGGGGKLPMDYDAYQNRTVEEDAAMSEADHRLMFQEGVRRNTAK